MYKKVIKKFFGLALSNKVIILRVILYNFRYVKLQNNPLPLYLG